MVYHLDPTSMSLNDLRQRLESTDLIPSHQPLLQGIGKKFGQLGKTGISSVEILRTRLRTAKALAATAATSGVDSEYLVVLRRAVEGFFPKPLSLRSFEWLDQSTISKLEGAGLANTEELHVALASSRALVLRRTGINTQALAEVASLSDLVRVQWVSPTFARVLLAAGYTGARAIASADPKDLLAAVGEANAGSRFYKGKLGLRDMKRLTAAAAYVPTA